MNKPKKINGISLGVTRTKLLKKKKNNLVIIFLESGTKVAGSFTKNKFPAAPVCIAKKHIRNNIKAIVINSGNANAGNGTQGMYDAFEVCKKVALIAGCKPENVLPFSTGIILKKLPLKNIIKALPDCFIQKKESNWKEAAKAIMTTDTVEKFTSKRVFLGGEYFDIVGIAKGSGMISPNMATMLSFIATDVKISKTLLNRMLKSVLQKSFNSITVDGDTSTNDSVLIMATGKSEFPKIDNENTKEYNLFYKELESICVDLAKRIVKDGEGATKFIEINILNAKSIGQAKKIGFSIANSPLVKTAMFASDPNLGRIISAIGSSGENIIYERISLSINNILVLKKGESKLDSLENELKSELKKKKIIIKVDLKSGTFSRTFWTCDLSYDYIRINADYRN